MDVLYNEVATQGRMHCVTTRHLPGKTEEHLCKCVGGLFSLYACSTIASAWQCCVMATAKSVVVRAPLLTLFSIAND